MSGSSSSPSAQSVLSALGVLHGDQSTNPQRQQAQQYIEQVKAQPQACLEISLALLQLSSGVIPAHQLATARHFALHGLQHLIAANWNQFTEDEKAYIKQQAIGIAENVSTTQGATPRQSGRLVCLTCSTRLRVHRLPP